MRLAIWNRDYDTDVPTWHHFMGTVSIESRDGLYFILINGNVQTWRRRLIDAKTVGEKMA